MKFSIRIVGLCRFLNEEKHEYRIADQMFRSGTSIGANVAEAQCAITKSDFVAKTYISLKECNETLYWLRLLLKTQYITQRQFESIYNDCEELKRLLVSITRTARQNIENSKQAILLSTFKNHHSSFIIHHCGFAATIQHSTLTIQHSSFIIAALPQPFNIQHSTLNIHHCGFAATIQHSTLNIQHS